jgi:hypothetical protein
MKRSPLALALSGLLFFGWLAYLGVQAWHERTPPVIVSRSQLLAARYVVVLYVGDAGQGKPAGGEYAVDEVMYAADQDGPAAGRKIAVLNLASCAGFVGAGSYVLPLVKRGNAYQVAVPPLDPGVPMVVSSRPTIYPVTGAVRQQINDFRAGVNQ